MTMTNQALSPNFNLSEFLMSQTAARRGIANQPSALHVNNLENLAKQVLEPVRACSAAGDVHFQRLSLARAQRRGRRGDQQRSHGRPGG
jgi:hypothetical protein